VYVRTYVRVCGCVCVCVCVCVGTYVSSTSQIHFSALTYSNYRTRMNHTIHCIRSSYVEIRKVWSTDDQRPFSFIRVSVEQGQYNTIKTIQYIYIYIYIYMLNKIITNRQTNSTEKPRFCNNKMKAVSNALLRSDNFCITFMHNALYKK
jgi:hypothetical protein